jgi:hypothetical protein
LKKEAKNNAFSHNPLEFRAVIDNITKHKYSTLYYVYIYLVRSKGPIMKLFSGIAKGTSLFVLGIALLSASQAIAAEPQVAQPNKKTATVQEKRVLAEQQFQTILKELSANKYFSTVAKHVFAQESLLNSNFSDKQNLSQTGPEAIKLINWLQNSNPEYFDANVLRKKLNKVFYLNFQEIISNIGLPQKSTNKMLGILEQLYKFKAGENKPFDAALSCGCLNISLSQTQKSLSLKEAIDRLNASLSHNAPAKRVA